MKANIKMIKEIAYRIGEIIDDPGRMNLSDSDARLAHKYVMANLKNNDDYYYDMKNYFC